MKKLVRNYGAKTQNKSVLAYLIPCYCTMCLCDTTSLNATLRDQSGTRVKNSLNTTCR